MFKYFLLCLGLLQTLMLSAVLPVDARELKQVTVSSKPLHGQRWRCSSSFDLHLGTEGYVTFRTVPASNTVYLSMRQERPGKRDPQFLTHIVPGTRIARNLLTYTNKIYFGGVAHAPADSFTVIIEATD